MGCVKTIDCKLILSQFSLRDQIERVFRVSSSTSKYLFLMDLMALFRSLLSKLIQLQQPSKLRASVVAYNLAFADSIGERRF